MGASIFQTRAMALIAAPTADPDHSGDEDISADQSVLERHRTRLPDAPAQRFRRSPVGRVAYLRDQFLVLQFMSVSNFLRSGCRFERRGPSGRRDVWRGDVAFQGEVRPAGPAANVMNAYDGATLVVA